MTVSVPSSTKPSIVASSLCIDARILSGGCGLASGKELAQWYCCCCCMYVDGEVIMMREKHIFSPIQQSTEERGCHRSRDGYECRFVMNHFTATTLVWLRDRGSTWISDIKDMFRLRFLVATKRYYFVCSNSEIRVILIIERCFHNFRIFFEHFSKFPYFFCFFSKYICEI